MNYAIIEVLRGQRKVIARGPRVQVARRLTQLRKATVSGVSSLTKQGTRKDYPVYEMEKLVEVPLGDLGKVCHACGEVSSTVMERTYKTKSYTGPCGDSFCYASCDLDTCRPVRMIACQRCEKAQRAP